MRLDVTIFEKSYAAFPENIEIIPDVLPVQIPPGGKDASVGADRNSQLNSRPRSERMVSRGDKTAADAARLFRIHPASVCRLLARQPAPPSRRPSMPNNVDGSTPDNVESDTYEAFLVPSDGAR
jgi:hypothetical protein